MIKKNLAVATAISSVLALGTLGVANVANAAEKEKCFGVAAAGKNDCQTASSSCAGTSTADAQGDAWVYVPSGLCEKLAGGSLESKG